MILVQARIPKTLGSIVNGKLIVKCPLDRPRRSGFVLVLGEGVLQGDVYSYMYWSGSTTYVIQRVISHDQEVRVEFLTYCWGLVGD